MKRFLLKLALFALPWLLLLTLAELYVESLPNIARDKHQWMLRNQQAVRTLVLGHSHTLYGIRPDLLGDSAFNLAQQSQTYRYDSYLLRHYTMPHLQTLILPFNYSSLWEDFEQQDEDFQAIRYRIYMDCDIHPRLSWYGFEVMSMPLVREKLQSLYRPAQNQWDSLGWATDYTLSTRADDWDNGRERAACNTYEDTTLVALNTAYLHDIFTFCRQHHIQVLLLNTPTSATFQAHEEAHQKAINEKVLHQLLTLYPEILYLDWEADPHFTPDDFYDADHLNTDGATKLTQLVKTFIRS